MPRAGEIAVAAMLAWVAVAPARPAAAIDITFDYSLDAGGLFTDPGTALATAVVDLRVAQPDPGHWAEGTPSTHFGSPQEAAMDPSTANGVRKYLTALDYAGLTDIGWQVVALPEPERGLLVAAGLLLLTGLASMPRSRQRPHVAGRPPPRRRRRARRRAPRRSRGFVRASG